MRKRFLFAGLLIGSALWGQGQTLSQNATLRSFESWDEPTAGPYKVDPGLWTQCMPPVGGPPLSHPGETAAAAHFIRVYANPKAAPVLRAGRGPKFPVGSILAKAKLLEGSRRPVSVAFMVKREKGYNPASLDWEFLFYAGEQLRPISLKAGATCQGCHGGQAEGDGVYGSYLAERRGTSPAL